MAWYKGKKVAQVQENQQPKVNFYYKIQKLIEQKVPNRTNPAQVLEIIRSPKAGVSRDELFWSGLEEWLESQDPKTKLSKADVLDQVKSNSPSLDTYDIPDLESDKVPHMAWPAPYHGEIQGGFPTNQEIYAVIKEEYGVDLLEQLRDSDYFENAAAEEFEDEEEQQEYLERVDQALAGNDPEFLDYLLRSEWSTIIDLARSSSESYGYEDDEGTEYGSVYDRVTKEMVVERGLTLTDATYKVRAFATGVSEDGDFVFDVYYPLGHKKQDQKIKANITYSKMEGDSTFADTVAELVGHEKMPMSEEYIDWTLPGGERYRETLIKWENMPHKGQSSTHFPDSDIVAHYRSKVRKDLEGNSVLFVEEIQSDWHQAGRERGYRSDLQYKDEQQLWSEYPGLDEFRADFNAFKKRAHDLFVQKTKELGVPSDTLGITSEEIVDGTGFQSSGENHLAAASFIRVENIYNDLPKGEASDKSLKLFLSGDDTGYKRNSLNHLIRMIADAAGWPEVRDKHIDMIRSAKAYERQFENIVESAPMASTEDWSGLVLKKAVERAVIEGHDKVAWTPGWVQNKRYNFSDKMDKMRLTYIGVDQNKPQSFSDPSELDNPELYPRVQITTFKDGRVGVNEIVPNTKAEIEKVIGFELHQRVRSVQAFNVKDTATARREFSGSFELDSSGMKGFYDQMLPTIAKKLFKRYGTQPELGAVYIENQNANRSLDKRFHVVHTVGSNNSNFRRIGWIYTLLYNKAFIVDTTTETLQKIDPPLRFKYKDIFRNNMDWDTGISVLIAEKLKPMFPDLLLYDVANDNSITSSTVENNLKNGQPIPDHMLEKYMSIYGVYGMKMVAGPFPTFAKAGEAAQKLIKEHLETVPMTPDGPEGGRLECYTIPITDKMRESVLSKGLSYYGEQESMKKTASWYMRKNAVITEMYDFDKIKDQLLETIKAELAQTDYFPDEKKREMLLETLKNFDFTEVNDYAQWYWFLKELKDIVGWASFGVRAIIVKLMSWSIMTKEAIDEIIEFSGGQTIMDLMAGSGYISYLIEKSGGSVEAFDLPINAKEDNHYNYDRKNWYPIKPKDIQEQEIVPNSTILLSWIPYQEAIANKTLKDMSPGQKLVLIGEQKYGCTATDCFFDILEEEFDHVKTIEIPQWEGLHDYVDLYVKKGGVKNAAAIQFLKTADQASLKRAVENILSQVHDMDDEKKKKYLIRKLKKVLAKEFGWVVETFSPNPEDDIQYIIDQYDKMPIDKDAPNYDPQKKRVIQSPYLTDFIADVSEDPFTLEVTRWVEQRLLNSRPMHIEWAVRQILELMGDNRDIKEMENHLYPIVNDLKTFIKNDHLFKGVELPKIDRHYLRQLVSNLKPDWESLAGDFDADDVNVTPDLMPDLYDRLREKWWKEVDRSTLEDIYDDIYGFDYHDESGRAEERRDWKIKEWRDDPDQISGYISDEIDEEYEAAVKQYLRGDGEPRRYGRLNIDGDIYDLYRCESLRDCKVLGAGTSWCFRAEEPDEYETAMNYLTDGDIWVIYKNNKPFRALDFFSKQYMDPGDNSMDMQEIKTTFAPWEKLMRNGSYEAGTRKGILEKGKGEVIANGLISKDHPDFAEEYQGLLDSNNFYRIKQALDSGMFNVGEKDYVELAWTVLSFSPASSNGRDILRKYVSPYADQPWAREIIDHIVSKLQYTELLSMFLLREIDPQLYPEKYKELTSNGFDIDLTRIGHTVMDAIRRNQVTYENEPHIINSAIEALLKRKRAGSADSICAAITREILQQESFPDDHPNIKELTQLLLQESPVNIYWTKKQRPELFSDEFINEISVDGEYDYLAKLRDFASPNPQMEHYDKDIAGDLNFRIIWGLVDEVNHTDLLKAVVDKAIQEGYTQTLTNVLANSGQIGGRYSYNIGPDTVNYIYDKVKDTEVGADLARKLLVSESALRRKDVSAETIQFIIDNYYDNMSPDTAAVGFFRELAGDNYEKVDPEYLVYLWSIVVGTGYETEVRTSIRANLGDLPQPIYEYEQKRLFEKSSWFSKSRLIKKAQGVQNTRTPVPFEILDKEGTGYWMRGEYKGVSFVTFTYNPVPDNKAIRSFNNKYEQVKNKVDAEQQGIADIPSTDMPEQQDFAEDAGEQDWTNWPAMKRRRASWFPRKTAVLYDSDDDKEMERAERYFSIGHGDDYESEWHDEDEPLESNMIWIWTGRGPLQVASETEYGTHAMAFPDYRNGGDHCWKGRYDPEKHVVSVVPPDRMLRSRVNIARGVKIPATLISMLESEFNSPEIAGFYTSNYSSEGREYFGSAQGTKKEAFLWFNAFWVNTRTSDVIELVNETHGIYVLDNPEQFDIPIDLPMILQYQEAVEEIEERKQKGEDWDDLFDIISEADGDAEQEAFSRGWVRVSFNSQDRSAEMEAYSPSDVKKAVRILAREADLHIFRLSYDAGGEYRQMDMEETEKFLRRAWFSKPMVKTAVTFNDVDDDDFWDMVSENHGGAYDGYDLRQEYLDAIYEEYGEDVDVNEVDLEAVYISPGISNAFDVALQDWQNQGVEYEFPYPDLLEQAERYSQAIFSDLKGVYPLSDPESWGTTGYVLPDGTGLNLSEGMGMRTLDHRSIAPVMSEYLGDLIEPHAFARDTKFKLTLGGMGAMIVTPEAPAVMLFQKPTRPQLRWIKQMLQDSGSIIVEYQDKGTMNVSAEDAEYELYRLFGEV